MDFDLGEKDDIIQTMIGSNNEEHFRMQNQKTQRPWKGSSGRRLDTDNINIRIHLDPKQKTTITETPLECGCRRGNSSVFTTERLMQPFFKKPVKYSTVLWPIEKWKSIFAIRPDTDDLKIDLKLKQMTTTA